MSRLAISEPSTPLAAVQINDLHSKATHAARDAVRYALQAGLMLVAEKEKLTHGEWLPWIERYCDFSARTARDYMALARRKEEVEANWQHAADLSIRAMLASVRRPQLVHPLPTNAPRIEGWNRGDWRQHVADLPAGLIRLLLMDPPYGINYRSWSDQHGAILNDLPESAASEVAEVLAALNSKLAPDAHIHIFCRWGESEFQFAQALVNTGYALRGSLVWVKNNTSMGNLTGAYAPKHERILHAVNGNPKLTRRTPDALECARVRTTRHPTENPLDLLRTLIETTTIEGDLVVDPFGGVASSLVAAKECGRAYRGCEVDENYHAIGCQRLGDGEVAGGRR